MEQRNKQAQVRSNTGSESRSSIQENAQIEAIKLVIKAGVADCIKENSSNVPLGLYCMSGMSDFSVDDASLLFHKGGHEFQKVSLRLVSYQQLICQQVRR
jgi:hypothetical protein